jgi:hypothetical protein
VAWDEEYALLVYNAVYLRGPDILEESRPPAGLKTKSSQKAAEAGGKLSSVQPYPESVLILSIPSYHVSLRSVLI